MVNTTDTYQEGDEITPDTRYLFNGTSCFPLSPCEEMKKQLDSQVNIISKGDQLIKILKILGHQDDVNISFITDQPAQDYFNSVAGNGKECRLYEKF